ncbi:MAG: thiamine biosynthesis protein ThiS [Acidobacteria bacterium RIFCSPLOWO2_12_FULL_54_10]|nr:MAG: thiamine biosynthesis protein ThiS [Acidobacteria bacterium RIFCSPLOWO2_12_FULL_54_10]
MEIVINGENRPLEAVMTLQSLLRALALPEDRIAVELNREIVRRDLWEKTEIKDHDRLEIVHFVGGG